MRTLETLLVASALSCSGDQTFSLQEDVPSVYDTVDTGYTDVAEETAAPEDTAPPCPNVESYIQPLSEPIDAVFVFDKSCSMGDDYNTIMNNFTTIYDTLPENGNWLFGMTVTNLEIATMNATVSLAPGSTADDFIALYNSFPSDILSGALMEQGFESLEAYLDAATWTREDAKLLVVPFSDEEDQSYAGMTDDEAVAYVESWLPALRDEVFIASVVNFPPASSPCNIYDLMTGARYLQVTQDLGGISIDICTEDWSSSVAEVEKTAVTQYTEWQLQYTPIADTIRVSIDHEPVLEKGNWSYYPPQNKILFLTVPEGGAYVEMYYDVNLDYDACPF